jgi:hypothetical protein
VNSAVFRLETSPVFISRSKEVSAELGASSVTAIINWAETPTVRIKNRAVEIAKVLLINLEYYSAL